MDKSFVESVTSPFGCSSGQLMSPPNALFPTATAVLFLLLIPRAIVSSVSVKPPAECERMAFAFGQLHSAPAANEANVMIKQYNSAINIAMKCMDSYLKIQKELFNEWLKHVSELERQLQQITEQGEQRGRGNEL